MADNFEKGRNGEKLAEGYLRKLGYDILEKNYSIAQGEIDIIAKYEEYYIFVEVKYRKSLENGYPREAVGKVKQRKIKNVALYYISKNELLDNDFRFDVIEVLGNEINHIENAFW